MSGLKQRVTELIQRNPQAASYIFDAYLEVELIMIKIEDALDNNLNERSAEEIFETKVNIVRHSGCLADTHHRKRK